MLYEEVQITLTKLLETAKHIEYKGIILYLLTTFQLQQVLALELSVRLDNIESGIEKKNHFYDFGF